MAFTAFSPLFQAEDENVRTLFFYVIAIQHPLQNLRLQFPTAMITSTFIAWIFCFSLHNK